MAPDGRPLQAASHAPPYGGGQPQKQPPSPAAARQEQQQERKRRFQESKEPPQHAQQVKVYRLALLAAHERNDHAACTTWHAQHGRRAV